MREPEPKARTQRVTFEQMLHQFRKHNFAVLSTVGEEERARSAGVNCGLSGRAGEFAIYVITRRHLKKAHNIGRRILAMYEDTHRRGETRTCFVKITPDPVISTYMVGYSAWELRSRGELASGKVRIPPELLPEHANGGRPGFGPKLKIGDRR